MYNLLIKAMILAAVIELGKMGLSLSQCPGKGCFRQVDAATRAVLKVDWKPLSVFPEEARRYR